MAGEHLLVVDDEEQIRAVFKEYFSGLGYEIVTARSGREAVEKCITDRFDCIICDHLMPEMDGLAFLQELRSRDKETPFLMMTGYPSIESAIEAIRQGAYDYITKPVNLEDVQIKLERIMHVKNVEKTLKKTSGLLWAVIISVPLWLVLGIILGIVWRQF